MLQSFLMVTLFTCATPGTPASKYIKCIISFSFVLESRSKVLTGELYAQR